MAGTSIALRPTPPASVHAGAGMFTPALAKLLCRLGDACTSGASEHCTALEQDPSLCSQLVSALLRALHRQAAISTASDLPPSKFWTGTLWLVRALCGPLLQQAYTQQLGGEDGAAVLESAAKLALCAPPDFGGLECTPEQHAELHGLLSTLLCSACQAQLQPPQGSRSAARSMLQLLPELLSRLGPLLQLCLQTAAADPSPLIHMCASWTCILRSCVVAVQLACPLPGSETAAASRRQSAAQRDAAADVDTAMCAMAFAAAAAALRLIPQLLEAGEAFAAAAAGIEVELDSSMSGIARIAGMAAHACVRLADAVCSHLLATVGLEEVQWWPAVQASVWQLHSASCRLLHWALSGSEPEQQQRAQLLPMLGQAGFWRAVTSLLGSLMSATAGALNEALIFEHHIAAHPSIVEQLAR